MIFQVLLCFNLAGIYDLWQNGGVFMESNGSEERLTIGRAALAKGICREWISGHSKLILISFLTLIALSFCIYLVQSSLGGGSRLGRLETERAFQSWISSDSSGAAEWKELEKPLHRYPDLEAKFGAQIAQKLLAMGDIKKGEAYAKAVLKRAADLNTPFYSAFSNNTLAIASGKYREALAASEALKIQMLQDDAFWEGRDKIVRSGAALYAYNLLRIAMLYQRLGEKEAELQAWEELVQNAGWRGAPINPKTYDPEAYQALLENFTQGDLSLLDYIEQRKR